MFSNALSYSYRLLLSASLLCLLMTRGHSQTNVLTQRNDNYRTGANLTESILNVKNVNIRQFGQLFFDPVDGDIYSQPLYVSKVTIPNKGTHNVVYVATEHNSVYAFDADASGPPLWGPINLGVPVSRDDIQMFGHQFMENSDFQYWDLYPEIGITSTPVIDLGSNTIYVVAKSKDGSTGQPQYHYKLHALDIRTGIEQPKSPIEISATLNSSGKPDANASVSFDPFLNLQRCALLLSRRRVYVAFASHGDMYDEKNKQRLYHGWVFSYDTSDLSAPPSVFCVTPNGMQGGIWQAGSGPAADPDGNVYVMTGNGTIDGANNYADCVLKLSGGSQLTVLSSFSPVSAFAKDGQYTRQNLNSIDLDVGATGPLLIPGVRSANSPQLLIAGDKEGMLYLLDRTNLGGVQTNPASGCLQSFHVTPEPNKPETLTYPNPWFHIHGAPVYWQYKQGRHTRTMIYLWPEQSPLYAYEMANGRFVVTNGEVTPAAVSTMLAPQRLTPSGTSMPGGSLSLSSQGDNAGTGILWATLPYKDDANRKTVPGMLVAFDAADIRYPLWTSTINPTRDDLGGFYAKFCPPTVANGKVYVATFIPETSGDDRVPLPHRSAGLVVYGLLKIKNR